jgi:hypothetical protein
MGRRYLAAALFAAVTLLPASSSAKSQKVLGYSYEAIWSTTIRFIRADKGYTIKDQDKANGYVLFIYPGAGSVKECLASLELFKITDDDGAKRIRVQLNIAHQPSYIEVYFLDTLETKLQDEQGQPSEKNPPPKEAPKPKAPEGKAHGGKTHVRG